LKKAPELRLLGEVLEDFLLSPVPQPTLLVCVPVRVPPGDGEATALDVAIVREYHEGSRSEPGMERVEKPAQWFASRQVRPPVAGERGGEDARGPGESEGVVPVEGDISVMPEPGSRNLEDIVIRVSRVNVTRGSGDRLGPEAGAACDLEHGVPAQYLAKDQAK
jgi:hypothetical protein